MKRKAITLVMLLLCLIFMAACSDQNDSDAAVNSGLTIDVSDLSSDISYFDYDADGIAMQLIARVDDAGTPKLSYNTCQSCAGSPYAFSRWSAARWCVGTAGTDSALIPLARRGTAAACPWL